MNDSPAVSLRTAPLWLQCSAAAFAVLALYELVPGAAESMGNLATYSAWTLRTGVEGAVLVWAATRKELPRRLRLSLNVAGWTSLVSALTYILGVAEALTGYPVHPTALDQSWVLIWYLAGLAAFLLFPMATPRRGEWPTIVVDVATSAGAIAVLLWVLITIPLASMPLRAEAHMWVLVDSVSAIAMVVGLNVLVLYGLATPSPRAFWLFVAGQAAYLPAIALSPYGEAEVFPRAIENLFYVGGIVPTLFAAFAFRVDPVPAQGGSPALSRLAALNPIPFVSPILLGVALAVATVRESPGQVLPLALTLVVVTALLVVRVLLTMRENARLHRFEAQEESRRQSDKMDAIGRLAGGIAHEFNNLLTIVIGNAELGREEHAVEAARRDFEAIQRAGERAAHLTRELLAFSGRQSSSLRVVDATAWLRQQADTLAAIAQPGTAVVVDAGSAVVQVRLDPDQLGHALQQLVKNATEATAAGGTVVIALTTEHLTAPLSTPFLSVPPGGYAVFEVSDAGMGIAPDRLRMIFDPFYTTKPVHAAAGLGLAAAHGVISQHAGGIAVTSELGRGTRVRVYLPLLADGSTPVQGRG